MSHLLDEILAQAANGSPAVVALSSESVATLLFASEFIEKRSNWLDRGVDPLDEVSDADWDEIEKLVANAYEEIMHPVLSPGSIQIWPLDDPPEHWLICNAQSLLRADYPALFDVIGTTYGAVDGTHFNLPSYENYSPMGASSSFDVGDVDGSFLHAISPSEMPTHTHTVTDPGHTHPPLSPFVSITGARSGGGGNAVAGTQLSGMATTGSSTTGITIGNSGSSTPMSLLHPVRAVHFIMYTGV